MKSNALIILFIATGVISPMSAATGIVASGTQPTDLPTGTKAGGTVGTAVLNVKTAPYNGKGDGVTNDTNAIQAAINDAEGLGGAVYLPAGTWMFSALRVQGANCIIQGAGKDVTILKAITGTGVTLVSFGGASAAPHSVIISL